MSHRKSITVGVDGKYYNIGTVVGGKTLGNKQATSHAIKNKALGRPFKSIDSAVDAAKKRSRKGN